MSSSRVAVLGLALVFGVFLPLPEGRGASGPGSTAVDPGSRPNLVIVLTDDQSAYSEADLAAAMPWLAARLADPADHWMTFSNAFLNTPLCCPTRASLLTGQYSHHTGVQENSQALKLRESDTLATWLDAQGYRTGLFGKYLNGYPMGWKVLIQPGWDRWFAFEQFSDPDTSGYYNYAVYDGAVRMTFGADPDDYSTDVLADEAVEFVETTPDGTPFLLYLSPFAPHGPHIPAPRHAGALSGYSPALPPSLNEADVSDKPAWVQALPLIRTSKLNSLAKERVAALETLLAVDEAIARVAGALEARGELEETVIVVMSDNGYAFGEHRIDGKRCGYVSCARTPLFIRYPGAPPTTESRPVSSVDIAPTFVELAGAEATIPMDGRSLVPLLEGWQTSWPEGVLIEYVGNAKVPGYWGLRTADLAYLELATGEVELYDLTGVHGPADPDEMENLCPGSPPVCQAPYEGERIRLAEVLGALRWGGVANAPPVAVAQASPSGATVGELVGFDGTGSSDAEDPAQDLTYEWDFEGDGTYDAAGIQVSHAYAQPGTYPATLRVTDTGGLQDTDVVQVTVAEPAPGAGPLCPGSEAVPGNHVVGTAGNDVLPGTQGDDVICGLDGDDTLEGNGGNDLLLGGRGHDSLLGGTGDDVLRGGFGRDWVVGDAGADELYGEEGADQLRARDGTGGDRLDGGPGRDRCHQDPGDVVVTC